MNNVSEREEGFENKFKHDETLRFKIHSHAIELLALWVAKQLKLDEEKTKEYANTLIDFDIDDPRSGDLERKVQKDLKNAEINKSEEELTAQLNSFIEDAKKELMTSE